LEDNKNDEDYLILYFVHLDIISGHDLRDADVIGKSDPFVEAVINGLTRSTPVIQDNLNPVWNSSFAYFVQKQPDLVDFHLFDEDDNSKNDSLGDSKLELKDLFASGKTFEGDLPVIYKGKQKGHIHVKCYCRVMHPVQTEKKLQETTDKLVLTEEQKVKVEQDLKSKEGELENKFSEIMALTKGKGELKAKFDEMIDQMAAAEVKVKTQDRQLAELLTANKGLEGKVAQLSKEKEELHKELEESKKKEGKKEAKKEEKKEEKKEGKKEEKKSEKPPAEHEFRNPPEPVGESTNYLVCVHILAKRKASRRASCLLMRILLSRWN